MLAHDPGNFLNAVSENQHTCLLCRFWQLAQATRVVDLAEPASRALNVDHQTSPSPFCFDFDCEQYPFPLPPLLIVFFGMYICCVHAQKIFLPVASAVWTCGYGSAMRCAPQTVLLRFNSSLSCLIARRISVSNPLFCSPWRLAGAWSVLESFMCVASHAFFCSSYLFFVNCFLFSVARTKVCRPLGSPL